MPAKQNEEKKLCPHCKMEVDSKATKCPHCQSKISATWSKRKKIFFALLIIIFIPVVINLASGPSAPVQLTADQIANSKKSSAESFGRSYVKSTLKSPSSAKFSYSTSVTVDEKDPSIFIVSSSVSSQNSYGAMLDNSYKLKMFYFGENTKEAIDDGSNWSVQEFYFDGKKIK